MAGGPASLIVQLSHLIPNSGFLLQRPIRNWATNDSIYMFWSMETLKRWLSRRQGREGNCSIPMVFITGCMWRSPGELLKINIWTQFQTNYFRFSGGRAGVLAVFNLKALQTLLICSQGWRLLLYCCITLLLATTKLTPTAAAFAWGFGHWLLFS